VHPLLTQILTQTTLKQKGGDPGRRYSDFELARAYRKFRISATRLVKDIVLITIGIFSAAFVVMHSVKDTKGGMIRERPLDHG
jgi:hypothetical protein